MSACGKSRVGFRVCDHGIDDSPPVLDAGEPISHLPRRRLLCATGAALATLGLLAPLRESLAAPEVQRHTARNAGPRTTLTAEQALQRLLDGNRRFALNHYRHPHQSPGWRAATLREQHPFAVVLGCADSRVPPEIVFDEGLGDLFVVRNAGQVVGDAVLGSIEYAVGHLGVPLIVVLGHEGCGAVTAALAAIRSNQPAPGHIERLVERIAPAAKSAAPDDTVNDVVHANVRLAASQLRQSEPLLSLACRTGAVEVVGAYYALHSGRVHLL